MKTIYYFFAFLCVSSAIQAQNEHSEPANEFSFAGRSTDATARSQRIPGDTLKFKRALKIFDKLVAARGDFRYAIPDFVMTRDERNVAWMNYDRLEVGLEEKAFDVCMTFGADADAALASLLGHELSHYYEKHSWRRDFARQYADLAVGKQLGVMTQADSVFNETQADYLGGFLAFSAGFPVFDKGADLTAALYKAYKLPDALRIYPSLAERKLLNIRSSGLLDKLVNVYQTANLLTIVGNYKSAVLYYQYVLQHYQSPALYNNVGMMTTLIALDLCRDTSDIFVLPLELDLDNLKSRGNMDFEGRDKLLAEAVRHFDAAINLNPDYAPAYLNKACVLILLHDYVRAKYYVEVELPAAINRNPSFKKTAVDNKVLLGILEMLDGHAVIAAEKMFEELVQKDSSAVAQENLVRLRTGKPSPFVPTPTALSFVPETIDNINLLLEAEELEVDVKNRISVGLGMTFYQNTKLGPNSTLLETEEKTANSTRKTYFLTTSPGYKGKTAQKISIGSNANAVFEAYKSPQKKLETTLGQLWLYNDIIFFLGPAPESKVMGWALWLEN